MYVWKRFFALCACLLVLGGSLTACTLNSDQGGSQTELPNPVVEYETPDFTQAAGFAVQGLPQNYTHTRCALINGMLAELNLLPQGAVEGEEPTVLRIAVDEDEDISGVYMTNAITRTENFEGTSVEIRQSTSGQVVATWLRNGYRFSIYQQHGEGVGELINSLTTGLTLTPSWAPNSIGEEAFQEWANGVGMSTSQVELLGKVGLGYDRIMALSQEDIVYFFAPGTLPYASFIPSQNQEMELENAGLSADKASILYNLGYSYEEMLTLPEAEKTFIFPNTALVERLVEAGFPRDTDSPYQIALGEGESYKLLIRRALGAQ